MSPSTDEFIRVYRETFDAYLRDRDERALNGAYELGRLAFVRQLSVLDLAVAHQEAMLGAVHRASGSLPAPELIRAAGDFFIEGLSAFEVAQRALQEARETARMERRQAVILRRLSTFLADASLALDATDSLEEMLQLVAEHARELVGAGFCAAQLELPGHGPSIDAVAVDAGQTPQQAQLSDLATLYRAIRPPGNALRMTGSDLEHYRARHALSAAGSTSWQPRGWLVAPLTALDGRDLGVIQVFDKQSGDFSELDEAILMQLAQMASAAVDRATLYRRVH